MYSLTSSPASDYSHITNTSFHTRSIPSIHPSTQAPSPVDFFKHAIGTRDLVSLSLCKTKDNLKKPIHLQCRPPLGLPHLVLAKSSRWPSFACLSKNYLKISYLRYLFTYKPINTIVPFEEYRPSTTNPQYCTIGGCERTCSNSSSYDTAERWLLFSHSAPCANLTCMANILRREFQ